MKLLELPNLKGESKIWQSSA